MTLPLFWRLMLSHVGILVLSGAVCLYSIVQLGTLGGAARSALDMHQRMIANQEALTDAFLSQVRYGGKYLITHTEGRYDQLRQFKADFLRYFDRLKQADHGESIRMSLARIERLHAQYHELFDREVTYIRARQIYAQTRYQQERERIVETTLSELDLVRAQTRGKLEEELESIERGARTARKLATATMVVVLVLGALLSVRVARSVGDASGPQPWPTFEDLRRRLFARRVNNLRDRCRRRMTLHLARWGSFAVQRIAFWSRRSGS